MPHNYGSVQWLEEEYRKVNDDPWGLSWRGFERCRYEQTLAILKEAMSRLRKPGNEVRILDVGCSSGHFTHRLPALGGQVTGMDLSETAVRRARKRYPNLHFRQASVYDCAQNLETYDVIVCLEVIYYVEPSRQDAFLAAMHRILSPGGILLISSKSGPTPYFTERDLMNLATRHFELTRIVRYGCDRQERGERFFFGLWRKAHQARILLLTSQPGGTGMFTEPSEGFSVRREILRKLKSFTDASPVAGKMICALLQGFIAVIKLGLRWSLPSRLANRLARWLHLSPTHTILALTKKP